MEKTFKRLLSFAVALVMILGVIPVTQIEAKAETTTQTETPVETPTETPEESNVIELPRTDGKKVQVNLDTVNDSLVPIGDVAEDGTMTAFCAACGENATWWLLTENTEPKVAINEPAIGQSHVHYYLGGDVTTGKLNELTDLDGNGKIESNDPNDPVLKNKWEDQLFYLWVYQTEASLCLHLNGHTLTTTDAKGYAYVGNGTMNIMGQGTFNGAGTGSGRGAAVTLNTNYANTGIINLLGGTFNTNTARQAVSSSGRGGNLYIYKDATVENVYVQGGTMTLAGGKINGDSTITNYCYNSDSKLYSTTNFVMESGEINGLTRLNRVANAANLAQVTFTINGGTINGKGTKDAPYTSSGSAINMSEGARLIINGGTINGGYSTYEYYVTGKDANDKNVYHDTRTWGGAIYTAPSWKNTDVTKVQTYIEMNGGTINAAGQGTTDYIAYAGGAIYLYGYKSGDGGHPGGGTKFVMNGGTINGGKVAQYGGAIYANSAQIELNGGTIQGGNAAGVAPVASEEITDETKYTYGQGGNLFVAKGAAATNVYFKMGGTATVKDGDAIAQGGNIYLNGIEMVMEQGTVSGGYIVSPNTGGGNIFVDASATLTMKGGTISGGINYWNQGGNIYVDSGTFNMSGGKIEKGIACNGASISVRGTSTTDKAIVNITGGTISGGATTGTATYGRGGNIYIASYCDVAILGATVTGGTAKYSGTDTTYGGGNICMYGSGSTLTVGKNPETGLPGVISNGIANASSGGNICVQTAGANVILNDGAQITGGQSKKSGFYGGNIYVNEGTLTVNKGATVSGGTAVGNGGNLYVTGTNAAVSIDGATFTGGTAVNGGSIFVAKGKSFTVSNSSISGGTATTSGGNMHIAATTMTIENSQIFGGTANGTANAYTGGGNIYLASGKTLTIEDSDIYGGIAKGSGGNILTTSNSKLYLQDGTNVYEGESKGTVTAAGGGNIQTSTGHIYVETGAAVYGGTAAQTTTQSHEIGAIYGGNIYLHGGIVGSAENKDRNSIYIMRHIGSDGTDYPTYLELADGTLYGGVITANNKSGAAPTISVLHGKFSYEAIAAMADANTKVVEQRDGLYEVHDKGEKTATPVPPTCTEDGYTLHTCSYVNEELGLACTGYKTDAVKANGHAWNDATCTAPKTCGTCGETEGEANGHDWADATCTAPKTCKTCGETEGEAKGHAWNDATCTAPKTCGTCGETEGEANGHDWADATCTAPKTCKTCGETEGEANGHDWADATCTAPKTCKTCGETEGEANGHDWADATCTAPKTCKTCGETEGEAKGHAWNDATCTAPKTCGTCGETEGEANGHDWADATCTAPKTCKTCGETEGEANGHAWNEATCTAPKTCGTCGETEGEAKGHAWNDATCTAPKTCGTCGETEGEAKGHAWNEATCTAPKTCGTCGETEGEAKGHAWNEATCTAPKTCATCGATEGEAAGHKLTLIPEVPAQVNKPGAEAYYQCDVCAKKFSDEGKTEIEAPKEIPALPEVVPEVPQEIPGASEDEKLTTEQVEEVTKIVTESSKIHEVAGLPDNTQLEIVVSSATYKENTITTLVYEVTPVKDGEKVTEHDEITFNLPVPKTDKTTAALFHEGDLIDAAREIKNEGNEYWVEVKSSEFSKFSVVLDYVDGEAKVGDTAYATLAEAVAAANAVGGQVDLQKDVEVSVLVELATNVVLNLNGHKLTVKKNGSVTAIYNDSAVIDTSKGREGRLVVEEGGKLYLPKENRQLPVDMGNGLMFVDVAVNHGKGSINGYQTWIDGMDKELAEALKTTGASKLGLKFQVVLTWGSNELTYTFGDDTVGEYAKNWQTYAMYLKVSGAEGLNLQYKFQIAYTGISTAKVAIDTANEIAH